MASSGGARGGPPDFIGVGTPDADTRLWLHLLVGHPEIHASPQGRHLRFFGEFCERELRDEDVADYHARFPRPPSGVIGEWSPSYMAEPWTPRLLQRVAPDARIIVMVSDPVLRYRQRLARLQESGDGEDRIVPLVDAVARGRYGTQLRNLREWFGEEQILVLQTERCRREPRRQYALTLRFLGVDEGTRPHRFRRWARTVKPRPAKAAPKPWYARLTQRTERPPDPPPRDDDDDLALDAAASDLWPDVEAALVDELRPEAEQLAALAPEVDLALWPSLS